MTTRRAKFFAHSPASALKMNAVHGGEGQLGVLHGACAEQRVDGYGHDAGGVMPAEGKLARLDRIGQEHEKESDVFQPDLGQRSAHEEPAQKTALAPCGTQNIFPVQSKRRRHHVHQKFLYGLKRSLQGGKRSSQDDEADGIFFRPLSGGSACPESGR